MSNFANPELDNYFRRIILPSNTSAFPSIVFANDPTIGLYYDLDGIHLTGLSATPTDPTEAASKAYVDASAGGGGATMALDNLAAVAINTSLLPGVTNTIDLGSPSFTFRTAYLAGNLIIGSPIFLADGSAAGPTLSFSSDNNTGLFGSVGVINFSVASQLITSVVSTGLDLNTHTIINVIDPTNPQDVATKNYVDTASSGANVHLSNLSSVAINTPLFAPANTTVAYGFTGFTGGMLLDTTYGNIAFNLGPSDAFTGVDPDINLAPNTAALTNGYPKIGIVDSSKSIVMVGGVASSQLITKFEKGGGPTGGLNIIGNASDFQIHTDSEPLRFSPNNVDAMKLDNSSTATETRMLLWDVDKNALSRVTVGAADSGGTGFKLLRVPN